MKDYTSGIVFIKIQSNFSAVNTEVLKMWFLILIPCFQLQAQTGSCVLLEPTIIMDFGAGSAKEMNISSSYQYSRVYNSCPGDGHYSYTPYTSDCFNGDWITLTEDHTPGDNHGNMLLVNASYESGDFFNPEITGLKPGANYEFTVWILNVCKPTEKCPYPLLPDISIQIKTSDGRLLTELNTGRLHRTGQAIWTNYSVMFQMQKTVTDLTVSMTNHSPGGCGNDFAMDDISFRECIITPPPISKKSLTTPSKKTNTATNAPTGKDVAIASTPVKKQIPKPVAKTTAPPKQQNPLAAQPKAVTENITVTDTLNIPIAISPPAPFYPPPTVLVTRTNALVKIIETGPGDIKIDLFDNGEIDGDTVSVYHNNKLILSHVRLSNKALSFTIAIDAENPHHELVMVANNLGSIPPNTSLMYVTADSKRYEVFISSNEQKNAKVIFDLRK